MKYKVGDTVNENTYCSKRSCDATCDHWQPVGVISRIDDELVWHKTPTSIPHSLGIPVRIDTFERWLQSKYMTVTPAEEEQT